MKKYFMVMPIFLFLLCCNRQDKAVSIGKAPEDLWDLPVDSSVGSLGAPEEITSVFEVPDVNEAIKVFAASKLSFIRIPDKDIGEYVNGYHDKEFYYLIKSISHKNSSPMISYHRESGIVTSGLYLERGFDMGLLENKPVVIGLNFEVKDVLFDPIAIK